MVVILEAPPTQDENGTNGPKSPSRRKQHILAKVKRDGQREKERQTQRDNREERTMRLWETVRVRVSL